jgi:predicted AlkP superfamily pyrophosphatase or phosphodiesterase
LNICKLPRRILLLAWVAVAATAGPSSTAKPLRPIDAAKHVVLISIDGLRPDLALRANMPTLRSMLRDGAYTFWAQTTAVAVTLPSHTSMVTGVSPDKHGVSWNSDPPPGERVYSKRPTVMEMATTAGYVTAMVVGKSKFATLDKPGAITHVFMPSKVDSVVSNDIVATHAEEIIGAYKPDLLFVHFADADTAGHTYGWGSPEQIAAIEKTDEAVARIFAALDRGALRANTVVFLSADHGGAGLTHGLGDARSRYIPWIVVGPGVKHGYDLTRVPEEKVPTEATAATICYLLGLPQQPYFDAKPVLAAFAYN